MILGASFCNFSHYSYLPSKRRKVIYESYGPYGHTSSAISSQILLTPLSNENIFDNPVAVLQWNVVGVAKEDGPVNMLVFGIVII